ncbi:MAG: PAS domain S-box protein [Candidatus Velamenicoccus archaeovorus]
MDANRAGASSAPPLEAALAAVVPGAVMRPLFDHMPAVVWVVDAELRFLVSEGGGLAALGTRPGHNVGRTLFEYFETDDAAFPPIAAHLLALSGAPATYEMDWAGRTFHTRVEPIRAEDGRVVGAIGFAIDLTERRLAERELERTEARYRALVEQIPAVIYISGFGRGGRWSYVSPKIAEVLGYSAEEWMTQPDPLTARLHPDDRERVVAQEVRARESGSTFSSEYRVRARDGRVVWIRDEAVRVPTDHDLWQGVMLDITAQKDSEQILRTTIAALRQTDAERRDLLERLVQAREDEQRRIAAEVHDGPVQKMVAVALRLQMLRKRSQDPEALELLDGLVRMVRSSTQELRHLLFQLVPPVLETEGLSAALRAFLHELDEETDLGARLDDRLGQDPGEPARTVCFRIVQEALRNTHRHARARAVEVLVERVEDQVHLRVRDDGVGFDVAKAWASSRRGLLAMREWAERAGGRLEVDSAPGAGTTVEVWVPASGSAP